MSGFIPLIYSTIGAVLGAGLTQYVTHIRDRRAARALIIERLHDAEAVFARSRFPEEARASANKDQTEDTCLEKALALLESACLIAGVPQTAVAIYRSGCMLSEIINRSWLSFNKDLDSLERAVEDVNHRIQEHSVNISEDARKQIAEIQEGIAKDKENSVRQRKELEAEQSEADHVREAGLILLRGAIWHPYVIVFHRRKVAYIKEQSNELEKRWKNMLVEVRKADDAVAKAKEQWLSARVAPP